jgi:putative hydrolase of HD superfamily
MLRKSLILQLFDGFSIQRWNDQIRPIPFVEMDKNAHKMAIAYCLAKFEETGGRVVNWHDLIRGGVFELLRRTVLSDIKSPIYRKIRSQYPDTYQRLSQWEYEQLLPMFANECLLADLRQYLTSEETLDACAREILTASHIYASHWEFQIIRQASPEGQNVRRIENMMILDLARYAHLVGVRKLLEREPVASFIDLFGQLRFQVRWGQTPRIPMTSVLGHSMMVASLCYLLTREIPGNPCNERIRNNFFGGLFHDLPEAVTRDIISPAKAADPKLPDILSEIEAELVQREIYPLLDSDWRNEFKYYTHDEFSSKAIKSGNVVRTTSEQITKEFDSDEYSPVDGELIRVSDHLAAFVEAHKSIQAGFSTRDLQDGVNSLRDKYKRASVAGIRIDSIYGDFD